MPSSLHNILEHLSHAGPIHADPQQQSHLTAASSAKQLGMSQSTMTKVRLNLPSY